MELNLRIIGCLEGGSIMYTNVKRMCVRVWEYVCQSD